MITGNSKVTGLTVHGMTIHVDNLSELDWKVIRYLRGTKLQKRSGTSTAYDLTIDSAWMSIAGDKYIRLSFENGPRDWCLAEVDYILQNLWKYVSPKVFCGLALGKKLVHKVMMIKHGYRSSFHLGRKTFCVTEITDLTPAEIAEQAYLSLQADIWNNRLQRLYPGIMENSK